MIIYYKELNGEPSTYEPIFENEKELKIFIENLASKNLQFVDFFIDNKTKIFLNKDFILQVGIKLNDN